MTEKLLEVSELDVFPSLPPFFLSLLALAQVDSSLSPSSFFSSLQFINNPTHPLFSSQHLKYRNTLLASSVPHLDDLLVQYANDWYEPNSPVTRETSVTGPGLGALLASLCWALLEVGEGVLLSTVS